MEIKNLKQKVKKAYNRFFDYLPVRRIHRMERIVS
jgi:hypothetical protein